MNDLPDDEIRALLDGATPGRLVILPEFNDNGDKIDWFLVFAEQDANGDGETVASMMHACDAAFYVAAPDLARLALARGAELRLCEAKLTRQRDDINRRKAEYLEMRDAKDAEIARLRAALEKLRTEPEIHLDCAADKIVAAALSGETP